MEQIGIVTEGTADLPLEMTEKLQVSVVPVKLKGSDRIHIVLKI